MEAIEALRAEANRAITVDRLGTALRARGNNLVSKAAALAADLSFSALIPDLLAAFDRHFIDPLDSDPQCWAKNAIAKALRHLGHHDAQVFTFNSVRYGAKGAVASSLLQ